MANTPCLRPAALRQSAAAAFVRSALASAGNALRLPTSIYSSATGHRTRVSRRCGAHGAARGLATAAGLSYAEGPREPPLLTQTIPDHFASIVSRYGDHPAVVARAAEATESCVLGQEPPTTTLTFASLDSLTNALAHSLRSLGVRKGDRVAVSLGNVPEHVALTYAAFKLGAIIVPLNPSFNAPQLAAALSHLGVELLIINAVTDLPYKPCRGRSNLDLLSTLVPDLHAQGASASRVVESPAVPTLRHVVVVDNTAQHPHASPPFPLRDLRCLIPYDTLLPTSYSSSPTRGRSTSSTISLSTSSSRPVTPDAPLSPSETINIQFTSGTTSAPKAAMLTHTNVLNNGHLIGNRMGLVGGANNDEGDRIICPPPLFHCFGCVLGLQATVTHGAALLMPSPAFDPAASLRMAAAHRATGLYGVPTMFVNQLELLADGRFAAELRGLAGLGEAEQTPFPLLRKGIAAGSSVPEALMRCLQAQLGLHELVICYGMTETSPVSAMTGPSDPPHRRTASVGRAMPHTTLKIVAPGDRGGAPVPRGQRGELAVSGYLVMQGYWADEARTAEDRIEEADGEVIASAAASLVGREEGEKAGSETQALRKRVWMYSGDEARLDADGFVEITGRIKDLIIRGGENIHPLEIENCLFQHPLISQASVVGIPDSVHGEVVSAFIVPHGQQQQRLLQGKATATAASSEAAVLADEESVGEGGEDVLTARGVRDWVRGRLSGHLVPTHVFWIREYPKTASGKIQKFKLRDLARELLDSRSASGGRLRQ